ncbi:uncharacterized protein BJ212DRAFT_549111 [Suillus subaureus]|uniref:Uncharacterized protein n=1 Tax=Suillus subaureus TaxID=48587 RepID=A0A9P7JIP8_9AGAM|nr:uncharacterized protein BJ212DRAFT_549111 [Suillus subaureus]KAG1824831.1 hypothetical protein BJ212DRAFT_549111 [Suillus subaureus]
MLTTSVVFVSTQPPMTSFLRYILRGSYIFAFLSFAHALDCLMCGLAVVNIYDACDRTWVKDVLTASRFRLCCTPVSISWPGISLTVSIIFPMLAILNACCASGVWWVQCLTTVEVLSWAWLPPLFAWCVVLKKHSIQSVSYTFVMFPG